jgi:hypothetical protein
MGDTVPSNELLLLLLLLLLHKMSVKDVASASQCGCSTSI